METLEDTKSNCSKCGKACKDKRGLRIHEARCSGLSSFDCEECGSSFQSFSNLKRHQSTCDKYRDKLIQEDFIKKEEQWKTQLAEKEEQRKVEVFEKRIVFKIF